MSNKPPSLPEPVIIGSRWENGTYILELFAGGVGNDPAFVRTDPIDASRGSRDPSPPGLLATRDLWEVQEVLARIVPEKVLLDLTLPIRKGVELLRIVKETCPDAEVVARVRSQVMEARAYTLELGAEGLRMTPLPEPSRPASP